MGKIPYLAATLWGTDLSKPPILESRYTETQTGTLSGDAVDLDVAVTGAASLTQLPASLNDDIAYIVIRCRPLVINPFQFLNEVDPTANFFADISNYKIKYNLGATQASKDIAGGLGFSQDAGLTPSEPSVFVETLPIALDPDGNPWTRANVNALVNLGVTCKFFNDTTPWGPYVGALRNYEVQVRVYCHRPVWVSKADIMALPTSGVAWDGSANGFKGINTEATVTAWGAGAAAHFIADLTDQDNFHADFCVAAAIVAVRTANNTLRDKVKDEILLAKRTLDAQAEYDGASARTLSLGRQLGGYVIAADIIDLPTNYASADAEFRPWLTTIRNQTIKNSNVNWQTLITTHEKTSNNWGAWAGASLMAADVYLGDVADLDKRWKLFKALSDRASYPSGAAGGSYFIKYSDIDDTIITASPLTMWTCINPAGNRPGGSGCGVGSLFDCDGADVSDIGREDATPLPHCPWDEGYPHGVSYSWETITGVAIQAEILFRSGYDSYNWGGSIGTNNKQVKRLYDFMVRFGLDIGVMTSTTGYRSKIMHIVPWLLNKRYGTSYTTDNPISHESRMTGWTNYTHQ